MDSLTRENLQYIAGFFDGEGSISLFVRGRRDYKWHQLSIQITNGDKIVLEWMDEVLVKCGCSHGLFVAKHRGKKFKAHWKPCWDLQWTSLRAEKVLQVIAPFLKTKHRQAILALEFRKTYPPHWNRRKSEESKVLMFEQRDIFRERLKALRKVG